MFRNGDIAEVSRTGSFLDGLQVTVVGVASKHAEFTTYIIELQEDDRRTARGTLGTDGWKCITLTESCLRKVD